MSLQACFVMNSLFRGFINEKNIHDRYIYTIKFKIYILCIFSIIECLFSCNVIGLCFCDGMKIRVRFVCLVMTVTRQDNNITETYVGLTENDFKTRYRNHTASFRHAKHRNSTELSKYIWTVKDNNINFFISWRILSSSLPYKSSNKRCNLCLKEKFLIICRPELSSLNKRNELVSSCRHRNKALLRYS